ncbi:MAG: STAS/SEC14 domain-containing protein [Phenylobacterium sp.]|jgi:hypothetical protein|uniref:STAS/SEC14 domain-containing protein n=1 Tax=Phenylobacterium sp. TaxID=1871053 RepID=UPI00391DB1F3
MLPAADHVVAFRVEGLLTEADYDEMIPVLEAKLKAHPQIGLYGDMMGFTGMTLPALARDIRYSAGKLGQLDRFRRAAVVSDNPWIRGWVKFMDPIFPQVQARAFDPGEREAALAWASDLA